MWAQSSPSFSSPLPKEGMFVSSKCTRGAKKAATGCSPCQFVQSGNEDPGCSASPACRVAVSEQLQTPATALQFSHLILVSNSGKQENSTRKKKPTQNRIFFVWLGVLGVLLFVCFGFFTAPSLSLHEVTPIGSSTAQERSKNRSLWLHRVISVYV